MVNDSLSNPTDMLEQKKNTIEQLINMFTSMLSFAWIHFLPCISMPARKAPVAQTVVQISHFDHNLLVNVPNESSIEIFSISDNRSLLIF